MGREILSNFTPSGIRERSEQMTGIARHESGHALMHLLNKNRRIFGFFINRLHFETVENIARLLDDVPILQNFTPPFGVMIAEDLSDGTAPKDSNHDVLQSLAGLATEHGEAFAGARLTFPLRYEPDFAPITRRLNAQLPPEKTPCSDDVIFSCSKRIVGELHNVFQSHFTCRRGIDAMTKYMVRHEASVGSRTHTDLLKVVESEGLDATKRQELLNYLASIDVDALLR